MSIARPFPTLIAPLFALLAIVALGPTVPVQAQAGDAPTVGSEARPAADPADVTTIDALMGALYGVISGPAGERDWDRFRSLFHADGKLVPVVARPGATPQLRTLTPEDYVRMNGPYFATSGFYESELNRVVERFGHIAHVFSTYESRTEPDAEPFARGINSLQLFFDGTRWWVLSISWDNEGPGQEIPAEYLPSAGSAR